MSNFCAFMQTFNIIKINQKRVLDNPRFLRALLKSELQTLIKKKTNVYELSIFVCPKEQYMMNRMLNV